MQQSINSLIDEEEAISWIVTHLKSTIENPADTRSGIAYGYDLYLPRVMTEWRNQNLQNLSKEEQNEAKCRELLSPLFYDASWELCRLGVLRPSIKSHHQQHTDDGSAGNGYSITKFGRKWLSQIDENSYVPLQPGKFSEMIKIHAQKFGVGFHERADQALRCYQSTAYLACCVMCGAAAESILLHLAVQKEGDEETILKLYKASNGRNKLENFLVGKQKNKLKEDFDRYFDLLKYWRDEAGHGRESKISSNEAYTSLLLLLRFAIFAKDDYDILTKKI